MRKQLAELYRKIHEGNEKEDINIIEGCFQSFVEYSNSVVLMEIKAMSFMASGTFTSFEEYMLKSMNGERAEKHDFAINNCNKLNCLCKKYNVPNICNVNLNNRHDVADFIGMAISEIYNYGIGKSIDDIVKEEQIFTTSETVEMLLKKEISNEER